MDRETVPAGTRSWLALVFTVLLATSAQAQDAESSSDFDKDFAVLDVASTPHDLPESAVDLPEFGPPVEAAPGSMMVEHLGYGRASFYGRRFAGRPTASGERFDPRGLTAAHRTLPFGSMVRVTNVRNGRSVVVRVNDRGPFHSRRVIDISRAAAEEIGLVDQGVGEVELELLVD